MRSLPLAAAIILACTGIAFSQAPPSPPAPRPSAQEHDAQSQTKQQPIQQQVQDNLKQAGYTDIKVMPESFLVRAKDKSGNPVMMVINPDFHHGRNGTQSAQLQQYDNRASSDPKQSEYNATGHQPKVSGHAKIVTSNEAPVRSWGSARPGSTGNELSRVLAATLLVGEPAHRNAPALSTLMRVTCTKASSCDHF